MIEKIESKLGKSWNEGLEEFQQNIIKNIDAKASKVDELKFEVTYMENEVDFVFLQKELLDQYWEISQTEGTEKAANELVLLLKMSRTDLKSLKNSQTSDALDGLTEQKLVLKSTEISSYVSTSTQGDISGIKNENVNLTHSREMGLTSDSLDDDVNCQCGYKHKVVPVIERPITLIQLLHVVKKNPFWVGPSSELVSCPFKFRLETEVINRNGSRWDNRFRIV